MPLPLEGIRVLDWTIWQQGPISALMMSDLGADVIKIEERVGGDPGRGVLRASGLDLSGFPNFYFEANNRGKRSIALDLKQPEAREIVHELVKKADVFVQNFRPGAAARAGLDYDTLKKINPKIIYGNGSGFGRKGPDAERPCMDYLGLAQELKKALATLRKSKPAYARRKFSRLCRMVRQESPAWLASRSSASKCFRSSWTGVPHSVS